MLGVRLQVVDERRGEERHAYSFNSTTVTPPPPCSGGAGLKFATNGSVCRNPAIARRSWPVP